MIIALTPLKEYIPGYDSTAMRRQAINNTYLLDSLRQQAFLYDRYLSSIRNVLTGNLGLEDISSRSTQSGIDLIEELDFSTINKTQFYAQRLHKKTGSIYLKQPEQKVILLCFPR